MPVLAILEYWQRAILGGGLGISALCTREMGVSRLNRYAMEVKRQLDVLISA